LAIRSSITVKLIGYLLAVSVAPLLVFGVASYELARRAIVKLAGDSNARLLVDQRDYLMLQSEQVASLAANIAGVEDIGNALAAPEVHDSYSALVTQAKLGYILSGYSNLKGLVSIDLFTAEGRHFHAGDTLDTSAVRADLRKRLYTATVDSKQSIVWHGVEDNVNAASAHRKVLVATKLIRRVDAEHLEPAPVGIVVINYSTDHLYEHFRGVDLGLGGYLMVADGQGRLLFHPDKSLIGQPLLPAFKELLSGSSGTVALWLNEEEVLLNYLRVEEMSWLMVDAPASWKQFQEDWTRGERKDATRAIHTLKSLAASVGAEPLRDLARALEAAARNEDEAAVTAGSPAAGQELARVLAMFQGFLESAPGSGSPI
jgi:hypothetical protein